MKRKELRSGYTTGACAAAASKAATLTLLRTKAWKTEGAEGDIVGIPFPDGSRATFDVHRSGYNADARTAFASVIKDAGDDPDVTNGAEIVAEVRMEQKNVSAEGHKERPLNFRASSLQNFQFSELPAFRAYELVIKGGSGVGVITKPGLAIPAGEPAINPVPRKMINEAVKEVIFEVGANGSSPLQDGFMHSEMVFEITISVTDGELLAKKTLNERLGIVGGLSILGTTGIVRPLSSEAWKATISSSMDVAKAMGRDEIVLSAGRTSEKAHMRRYNLSEESYVMMGDYLEFSLREAAARGFSRIGLCAQWAKMLKIAMATPQTHVRHGAIDIKKTILFLRGLGLEFAEDASFNTAREIFDYMQINSADLQHELKRVCSAAQSYAAAIADPSEIRIYLTAYDGEIVASSD